MGPVERARDALQDGLAEMCTCVCRWWEAKRRVHEALDRARKRWSRMTAPNVDVEAGWVGFNCLSGDCALLMEKRR